MSSTLISFHIQAGFENTEAQLKISSRLKNTWLKSGGSVNSADLFRRFRGRDPTPEALLRSLGLQQSVQPKFRSQKQ